MLHFTLVYNKSNSFDNLSFLKEEALAKINPNDPDFSFVLVENKIDKENERRVSREKAQEWCKSHKISLFFKTSAKDKLVLKNFY